MGRWLDPFSQKSLMPSDFYVFNYENILRVTTNVSAAEVTVAIAAAAATVALIVVPRKHFWLPQVFSI